MRLSEDASSRVAVVIGIILAVPTVMIALPLLGVAVWWLGYLVGPWACVIVPAIAIGVALSIWKAVMRAAEARGRDLHTGPTVHSCPLCGYAWVKVDICPECGYDPWSGVQRESTMEKRK